MFENEITSWLGKQIEDITIEKAKKLIIFLAKDISEDSYDKLFHYVRDQKGRKLISEEQVEEKLSVIKNDFKKIRDGKIILRYVIPYDENFIYSSYAYELDKELIDILNNAIECAIEFVYCKRYKEALTIFDLLFCTKYQCSEVNDLRQCNDKTLKVEHFNIHTLHQRFGFDHEKARKCAIYSLMITEQDHKMMFKKLEKYFGNADNDELTLDDCKNMGIEEIDGYDQLLDEWFSYEISHGR